MCSPNDAQSARSDPWCIYLCNHGTPQSCTRSHLVCEHKSEREFAQILWSECALAFLRSIAHLDTVLAFDSTLGGDSERLQLTTWIASNTDIVHNFYQPLLDNVRLAIFKCAFLQKSGDERTLCQNLETYRTRPHLIASHRFTHLREEHVDDRNCRKHRHRAPHWLQIWTASWIRRCCNRKFKWWLSVWYKRDCSVVWKDEKRACALSIYRAILWKPKHCVLYSSWKYI